MVWKFATATLRHIYFLQSTHLGNATSFNSRRSACCALPATSSRKSYGRGHSPATVLPVSVLRAGVPHVRFMLRQGVSTGCRTQPHVANISNKSVAYYGAHKYTWEPLLLVSRYHSICLGLFSALDISIKDADLGPMIEACFAVYLFGSLFDVGTAHRCGDRRQCVKEKSIRAPNSQACQCTSKAMTASVSALSLLPSVLA